MLIMWDEVEFKEQNNYRIETLFAFVKFCRQRKCYKFRTNHEPSHGTKYLERWLGTTFSWSTLSRNYGNWKLDIFTKFVFPRKGFGYF